MNSLFPEDTEGFVAKAPSGPLSKYCANCGFHLDIHSSEWIVAKGSRRVCPAIQEEPEEEVPPEGHEGEVPEADDECDPSPEETAPVPTEPLPYGTEKNSYIAAFRTGKQIKSGRRDHLEGSAVISNFEQQHTRLPCSQFNQSHLRGAGIHNLEDEEEKISLPCRRTNESHLRGAAAFPVVDHIDQNTNRYV